MRKEMCAAVFTVFLLVQPASLFAEAAGTPANPTERLNAIEKQLKTIEENQKQILENQEKTFEMIHILKIWIRRS